MLVEFLPRDDKVCTVCRYNIVAAICGWMIYRLMFSHQSYCDGCRQSTEHSVFDVDFMPGVRENDERLTKLLRTLG